MIHIVIERLIKAATAKALFFQTPKSFSVNNTIILLLLIIIIILVEVKHMHTFNNVYMNKVILTTAKSETLFSFFAVVNRASQNKKYINI